MLFLRKVFLMRNKICVLVKSFTYMKQQILERLGYSDRIERMFGRGNIAQVYQR